MKAALGLIETVGLAAAIEAADTAVKSANVVLVGYELSRGGGLVTVKLAGDVGAVKAAVEAGSAAARKVNKVWSVQVIPRPAEHIEQLIKNRETVGCGSDDVQKEDKSEKMKEAVSDKEEDKEEENEEEIEKEFEDEADTKKEYAEGERNMEAEEKEELEAGKKEEKESEKSGKDENEEDGDNKGEVTCNLCGDPACPRKKGELRTYCIHYDELKNK